MEIDSENSDAADSLASIKDIVTSKGIGSTITTDIITISRSARKHILALNPGHGYLLNRSGLIEVFNHDRNEMLLNDCFAVRDYLDTRYLEFEAANSQPGEYLSVRIDEVEQIGYSCDNLLLLSRFIQIPDKH